MRNIFTWKVYSYIYLEIDAWSKFVRHLDSTRGFIFIRNEGKNPLRIITHFCGIFLKYICIYIFLEIPFE